MLASDARPNLRICAIDSCRVAGLGCVAVLLGQDRGWECWTGLLRCDAWLGGLGCLVEAMV